MTATPLKNSDPWRRVLLAAAAFLIADLLLLLVLEPVIWHRPLALLALLLTVGLALSLRRRAEQGRRSNLQLQQGIAAMDAGFALLDADDRLLLVNEAYRQHFPTCGPLWQRGDRFEDMMRSAALAGETPARAGREEAWLAARMAQHRSPGEPWLQPLPDGRWMRVHERRTDSGVMAVLRSDVTAMVIAQEGMAQAQAQAQFDRQLLERALDAMPVGIEIYDEQDRLLMNNQRIAEWFPHERFGDGLGQSFETLLRRMWRADALPVDSQGREEAWLAERLAGRAQSSNVLLQQFPSGLWLLTHETRTPEGQLVSVRQDVTELKNKERALQAIIGTAGVAIVTLDASGLIRSANPATERMLGHPAAALVGQDVGLLMGKPARRLMARLLRRYLLREDHGLLGQQREFVVLHQSGRALTVQMALADVVSGDEHLFVAVLTDITERKRFEVDLQLANEQLLRLSTTDSLTELGNRRLLMQRLKDEWRRALRSREPLALLLLDVDYFKRYNDHYGHQAGDAALQTVARVLTACAHRPGDLAARYGGEEFVLLLPQTDAAGAHAVALNCMTGLRQAAVPHALSSLGDMLTLSIGLISGRADTKSSVAQWLAEVDLALYQAKAQGRNRVVRANAN